MIRSLLCPVVALIVCLSATCLSTDVAAADPPATAEAKPKGGKKKADATKWRSLNDKWEVCQFGGDGEVQIKENLITMDYGDPITGVRWAGDVRKDNYEIEVEARRVDGFDFFCALTFPVAEDHVSLVLGGWGGGTVGISSIDDRDASDNDTTLFRAFDNKKWYKARVRVETSRLAVWIDDVLQFEHPRKGHTFDIRYEMDPCLPLGLANFQCQSEFRNIRVRALAATELGAELKSKKPSDKKDAETKDSADEKGETVDADKDASVKKVDSSK
ncbi:MAG: hypothetical protein HKN47_25545 [Pirellulaceae bacterium]|nr:hypothetical protein [Pirellulaceae bacterium]